MTCVHTSPITFAALGDPDTMYFHQILNQPDKPQFLKAMSIEINDHNRKKHRINVLRSDLPPDAHILPCVWAMRRKRDLITGEITKWKARLPIIKCKAFEDNNGAIEMATVHKLQH